MRRRRGRRGSNLCWHVGGAHDVTPCCPFPGMGQLGVGSQPPSARPWARLSDAGPTAPSPRPRSGVGGHFLSFWTRLSTEGGDWSARTVAQEGRLSGLGAGVPTVLPAAGGQAGPPDGARRGSSSCPQPCTAVEAAKLPVTLDGLMQRDSSRRGLHTQSPPTPSQPSPAAGGRWPPGHRTQPVRASPPGPEVPL